MSLLGVFKHDDLIDKLFKMVERLKNRVTRLEMEMANLRRATKAHFEVDDEETDEETWSEPEMVEDNFCIAASKLVQRGLTSD
tara:strand:- start:675 stop:923 length:249 start_codon:yes stop_codon:yes gene_type:complete